MTRMSFTYPTHPKDFTPCQPQTRRDWIFVKPTDYLPVPQIRFFPCEAQSGLRHDIENKHCQFCKVYLQ